MAVLASLYIADHGRGRIGLGTTLGKFIKACCGWLSTGETSWPRFGIAESPWAIEFHEFGKLSFNWEEWVEGRFFGENAEMRWRICGGGIRGVLVSDKDFTSADDPKAFPVQGIDGVVIEDVLALNDYDVVDEFLVLWGTYRGEDGAWREDRIPRPLDYPVAGEGQPCMRVRHYVNDRGVAEYYRFVDLVLMRDSA